MPSVKVSYRYGFNADIGGGEYPRAESFIVSDEQFVFPFPDTAGVPRYTTLQQALDFATTQLAANGAAAVEITNSGTYPETGTLDLSVDVPAGCTIEMRAKNETRPTLLLHGEIGVFGGTSSTFALDGLLIAASVTMAPNASTVALVHVPAKRTDGSENQLEALRISHCTLVPGWSVDSNGTPQFVTQPNLVAEPAGLTVTARKSILGAIRAGQFVGVTAFDTIIDATDPAGVAIADLDGFTGTGSLTLGGVDQLDSNDTPPHGCTIVGKVHAVLLNLVSDTILWAGLAKSDSWTTGLIADRKQEGCVRFSFLPTGAKTPRRFECIERTIAGPQPIFFAFRYGRPGYMKLLTSTPDVVRRGADDGGEMGAFHFVLGPLREADLRVRMQEYLPVGLEFGIIYQN